MAFTFKKTHPQKHRLMVTTYYGYSIVLLVLAGAWQQNQLAFLQVPPLKFVEQIVCFFSFLISVLFGQFFSVYISVQFHLLQSNWVFFSHEVCKFFQGKKMAPWCSYHYCTTSFNQVWTQVLHRFKFCPRHVGDSRWWESLTMILSSVSHTTKTVHHHILPLLLQTRIAFDKECFFLQESYKDDYTLSIQVILRNRVRLKLVYSCLLECCLLF